MIVELVTFEPKYSRSTSRGVYVGMDRISFGEITSNSVKDGLKEEKEE